MNEGKSVHEVAQSGPGLAFVLFADAFTTMRGGHLLSILFFFMLCLLGLDSAFAWVQTLQTYVYDAILSRQSDGSGSIPKRVTMLSLIILCVSMFLLGLPFATRRGAYYLEVVDHFCPTYCLLVTVFFEYILLGYLVGAEKMIAIVETTQKEPLSPFWRKACASQMRYIGPIMLGVLFVFTVISEGQVGSSLKVNSDGYYVYRGFPTDLIVVGWLTVIVPVLVFVFYIVKVDLKRFFGVILWPRVRRILGGKTSKRKGSLPVGGYPHLEPDVIGQARERVKTETPTDG